ncbi:ArsR/SmtB family transcription factor [Halopelagius longus]|uniref:ArsR family transcriptional regulator n=1 Tax=Halopelagius longus TaxID=1236180 RepID=A0A1H1B204_9EURY|nr:winged helix-turn-helix domain-containing protein [Halopelagius longus]RDI70604.1 ArsR family transcriptional regulator [Halopelagius longus]SDQ45791.1 Helix-turn-helix domain-containing protein [Halopelagius longus]
MSTPLPSDIDVSNEDGNLRVLWLDDDEAERLICCLSSETARSTLAALQRNPATASELADSVDTSLQNVRHHLDNLRDANLVRVADTCYSVKGREMKVYAPTDDAFVVCVGGADDKSPLLDRLDRFVESLGILPSADSDSDSAADAPREE